MVTCPVCGNSEGYKICGVEVRGVYDGVLYWECWICGKLFHRFLDNDPLYVKAQKHMDLRMEPDK